VGTLPALYAMGQGLPKAVTPIVLERDDGPLFRTGLAEMNGWRPSMEDAHVIVMHDSWGFFGVFDGHGGQQCSAFVARRLTEELADTAVPEDDAAIKSLVFRIDKEFLDRGEPSGSTGTFALVQPLSAAETGEQQIRLRVGNIGDSRVLLCRADGTMVEGPGTDGGLTTDHKPDNDIESKRIYRTGGHVEKVMGVARVNGDLAVSRAFGDAQYKQTGGPAQEDHPVSAEPEFLTMTCNKSDFLMLVCDGISEGNFPNREVVQLAAEELKKHDAAEAAAAVCRRALERGSMDNLSCMIVLFDGDKAERTKELLPGPFTEPTHAGFRKAYEAMADRAGMSLASAVERRYDASQKEHSQAEDQNSDAAVAELRSEIGLFDGGPPKTLAVGSPERTKWFSDWLESRRVEPALDPENMSRDQMLDLLEKNPDMLAMAQERGIVSQSTMRLAKVAGAEKLRPAMEKHSALNWDDRLQSICNQTGRVLQEDPSDGTAQVRFRGNLSATVWLPMSCLEDAEIRKVCVGPEEQLRQAVEASSVLQWKDEMTKLAGQLGEVLEEDPSDGTTKVRFPSPLCITAWLPTSVLSNTDLGDSISCLEDDSESDDEDEAQDECLEDDPPLRTVLVPSQDIVRAAVEKHATFTWQDEIAELCGQKGEVLRDDESDGTSCVRFAGAGVTWLPTSILNEVVDSTDPEENTSGSPKRQRTS